MAELMLPTGMTKLLTTAVMHLPLLLVVLLSGPALIVCPFLPETWCTSGHALLRNLRSWHGDILDRINQTQGTGNGRAGTDEDPMPTTNLTHTRHIAGRV
jgi:hypothetical protein